MYKRNTDFVLGKGGESLKQPVGKFQGADGGSIGVRVLLWGGLGVLSFNCPRHHGLPWGSGVLTFPYLPIENVIRENQWGGVDIRRGGVPVLRSNLICFGYSDGVVVGDEGKGLIEGNTIYGEEGVPGAVVCRRPRSQLQLVGSEKAVSSLRPQKPPW